MDLFTLMIRAGGPLPGLVLLWKGWRGQVDDTGFGPILRGHIIVLTPIQRSRKDLCHVIFFSF